ncbi:sulfite exporter TauE/SafE family protein [Kroppenstedtia pulmonis]|uniref:Probable membrane transporter protein n=1 Tax=Kroppenstedtia pulmonis TaxID=1380685 RepID=A0A7D3Y1A6_9BACL|nr:sulfite exporter TauE/SafE family protein [Kroppenstedtia pulmonis]QKG85140.1 sulfite exporter TauE/SafE family protein [Kroppenstedtia pulmonis]
MSVSLILVMFLIGFLGSFLSGMLGIGGSIVKYPMLLYLPPLVGVATYTAQEVSALAMVQVFFATLAGMWAYRKSNLIDKRLVLDMGISIVIGSLIGGYGSQYISNDAINMIYGGLAVIAAIMMLKPGGKEHKDSSETNRYHRGIAISSSFVVGILSGIVGAGGAFILIPIMVSVLGIPLRITIASSLAIVFLSSIGGTIGKIMTGHILWAEAAILIIGSLLGATAGAKTGQNASRGFLQGTLAVLIILTALKIWFDILV